MLNQKAFNEAVRVFNKVRGSSVECLRAAISVFKAEEAHQHSLTFSGLKFNTADTEDGPDTALVITGFVCAEAINTFVVDALHAPGK